MKQKHRWRRLCESNPAVISAEMERSGTWLGFCVLTILVGAGFYGATIGLWRSPLQALYTGVKFPLVMLLTTAGNVLINGMLAQVLGSGVSFRQSTLAVVTSFALASLILAGLAPVMLFMWFNTPPLSVEGDALLAHNFTLLSHVLVIAFAGVMGNARLLRLLRHLSGSRAIAARVLTAWLAVNMFLGCQLSWNMRPFIGSPGLPVEFFREDAFRGNFYESTWTALIRLGTSNSRKGATP